MFSKHVAFRLVQLSSVYLNFNFKKKKKKYVLIFSWLFFLVFSCFLKSIDFHERGKNHKENVAKRISEVIQTSYFHRYMYLITFITRLVEIYSYCVFF